MGIEGDIFAEAFIEPIGRRFRQWLMLCHGLLCQRQLFMGQYGLQGDKQADYEEEQVAASQWNPSLNK